MKRLISHYDKETKKTFVDGRHSGIADGIRYFQAWLLADIKHRGKVVKLTREKAASNGCHTSGFYVDIPLVESWATLDARVIQMETEAALGIEE